MQWHTEINMVIRNTTYIIDTVFNYNLTLFHMAAAKVKYDFRAFGWE